jgi:peptide/nickel transport system substrate-binding protein
MTTTKKDFTNLDRRTFLRTVGVAAAVGVAGTALPINTVSWAKTGGTLSMLIQPEVPTLASYLSTSMPVGQAASKMYDGLLEYNFDLSPRPCLAESWNVSADGKTITFKIRKGVTFHDGKPMTAEDARYSIMEVLREYHPRGKGNFSLIAKAEVPDSHTLVLTLSAPSPSMLMVFSGYESPILPKHLFEGTDIKNHPNANAPVGTGPFKFVEWKRGQYMRLVRNPDYWSKDEPKLDQIVFRTIPDSATRSAVLEKGEVHIAGFGAVPYNDAARLAKLSNLNVTKKGYEMFSPIGELDFNTKVKPFDDKRVRQAVAYSIDRKYVVENIWFGFARPATGPINSNFAASGLYTDQVKRYDVPNGIELAEKLLDEAGYPRKSDGTRMEITLDVTPYGEEWQRFGEYTVQRMAKIGIKATIRYEDVATWLKRTYTDYDFQVTANWLNTFADPVLGVHRLYHSKEIKPGTVFKNASRWSSQRTDELMDMAKVEPDSKKRATYYHEFQKILCEEVPVAWCVEILFPTVISDSYRNVIDSAIGLAGNFRSGEEV